MVRRLILLPALAALLSVWTARLVYAQDAEAVAPAHVGFVDGAVTLERDGRPENSPLNMPLLSGDRLRTANGRVEVVFADGSTLHLDSATTVDFESDDLLRLIEGRVRLDIFGPSRQVAYRIDSPAGSASITEPGEYRLALLHGDRDTQLELAVLRGAAELFTDEGSTPLRAGERAYASAGLAPSYAYTFNSANWDDFDRWSEMRRDQRLGVSAQYLPADVRPYASVFDQYGDWRYAQPYGYVWYPRVAAGWRPYYYGRWMSYPRFGWTWIGTDLFGWPTHHYGRWGFSAGLWFWIPTSRWAPAYVSWAYAPGYVSWCPLGFDNRAVIAINVNVGRRFYSPWNAWTVVSASHFGFGFVSQRAVVVDRLGFRTPPAFVMRGSAPLQRGVAIPRSTAPIRWAGVAPGSRRDQRGTIGARDSYFSRGGDRGEHIAAPSARPTLPPSSRSGMAAPSRRADVAGVRAGGPDPRAPRAVPRGGVAPSPAREVPAPAMRSGAPFRTAPEGRVRPADPRGPSAIPRDRARPSAPSRPGGGPTTAPPGYYAPSPRTSVPVIRGTPPAPSAPQGGYGQTRPYSPGEYAQPRATAPEPRGNESREPRGYVPRAYEPRSAEPRQAPGAREPMRGDGAPPPQRTAPGERARPSGGGSQGQGRSSGGSSQGQAVPRRGGRGGR